VVYRAAIKTDAAAAFTVLKKEWSSGTTLDGKELVLQAMGYVRDPALIKDSILPFLFNMSPPVPATEAVQTADMHTLAFVLAANHVGRPLLWEYFQKEYELAAKKMTNPVVFDRFIKSFGRFTHVKYVEELEAFFQDKDVSSYDRTLEQLKDSIRGRAAYRERDAAVLKEWLSAHGYFS
jgi:hypothetical protein